MLPIAMPSTRDRDSNLKFGLLGGSRSPASAILYTASAVAPEGGRGEGGYACARVVLLRRLLRNMFPAAVCR